MSVIPLFATAAVAVTEPAGGPFEQPEATSASRGQARARREGNEVDELAFGYIETAGGRILDVRVRRGAETNDAVTIDAVAEGANGSRWWVLAHGNVDVDTTADHPGLRRTDTIRKAGFSAAVLGRRPDPLPILVITSHLPTRTRADKAARSYLAELAPFVWDVIGLHDLRSYHRLRHHLTDPGPRRRGTPQEWVEGPWSQPPLPFGALDA
jgi:hypothetical protein